MGPGVTGRVVRHFIFGHSSIHLLEFAEEGRTALVPACVPVKVGHKGLNLWAISYSKGGCLLELQDCVELDV